MFDLLFLIYDYILFFTTEFTGFHGVFLEFYYLKINSAELGVLCGE